METIQAILDGRVRGLKFNKVSLCLESNPYWNYILLAVDCDLIKSQRMTIFFPIQNISHITLLAYFLFWKQFCVTIYYTGQDSTQQT